MKEPFSIIYRLFCERGNQFYTIGEPVTQTQHAIQAAHYASLYQNGDHIVVAALLHDIGHLTHIESFTSIKDDMHERRGYQLLRRLGFSNKVTAPILHHVDAKRYLLSTNPDYEKILSDASRRSLQLQGGRMSVQEQMNFRSRNGWIDAIYLRCCDDLAKNTGLGQLSHPQALEKLKSYEELVHSMIQRVE